MTLPSQARAWQVGVLELWLEVAGVDAYHPYWDIVAAVGLLPEHPAPPVDAGRLDDFVARAVARL